MSNDLLLLIDLQTGYPRDIPDSLIKRILPLVREFDYVANCTYHNDKSSPVIRDFNWSYLFPNSTKVLDAFSNFPIFVKYGYSGLTDEFKAYLDKLQPKTIYLAGVYTDACVLATAFSLYDAGYVIKLLSDCCWSPSEERHNKAVAIMNYNLNSSCTSAEIFYRKKK